MTRGAPRVWLAALVAASTACAAPTTSNPAPPSTDGGRTPTTTTGRVDPAQAARLQRIMVPLIRLMDHPMPLDQVKVGIMDDQKINAANAGGNQFFVTTGLLHKASDDQLRAILAHELSRHPPTLINPAANLTKPRAIGAVLFWALGIPAPVLWGTLMTMVFVLPAVGPRRRALRFEGRWPGGVGLDFHPIAERRRTDSWVKSG